jgi:chromosome segregation ATPase
MQQSFWQRVRNKTGLAISAGLVVLTTIAGAEQCRQEIRGEQDPQQSRQNASHSAGQVSALENEVKKAQKRAQLVEKIADLAEKKLGALEAVVAKKEDQLEAELKEALGQAQSAKREVEFAKDERSALETELKNSLGRAQLTEKDGQLNDPDADRKPEPR